MAIARTLLRGFLWNYMRVETLRFIEALTVIKLKHASPSAVIFDVEGTLIDCVPLILESWRRTLLAAGHSFTIAELQAYSGMDGDWMLEQLLPTVDADVRQKLLKVHGDEYRAGFIHQAQPFGGLRDLFEQLKGREIAIGIATTCKKDELTIYDERMKVVELADAVVCGETVKHGKPDSALLEECLRSLKVASPGAALGVGDTPFDARAGRALGLDCAGVLTGGFSTTTLRDAGYKYVFDEVRQVGSIWDLHSPLEVALPG
jgi:phosphoglycolate phosphatase-like HAD superfamily hydrolase